MGKTSERYTDNQCRGKSVFITLKLAKRIARLISKEDGEIVHAYHCQMCGHYHVGHPTVWHKQEIERWRKSGR